MSQSPSIQLYVTAVVSIVCGTWFGSLIFGQPSYKSGEQSDVTRTDTALIDQLASVSKHHEESNKTLYFNMYHYGRIMALSDLNEARRIVDGGPSDDKITTSVLLAGMKKTLDDPDAAVMWVKNNKKTVAELIRNMNEHLESTKRLSP